MMYCLVCDGLWNFVVQIRLGWTDAAMIAGAREVGVSPSIVGSFPRKEAALVGVFVLVLDVCKSWCILNIFLSPLSHCVDKEQKEHRFANPIFTLDSLDSSIRLPQLKRSATTFTNISSQIGYLTDRRFTHSHLAQVKVIMPEILVKVRLQFKHKGPFPPQALGPLDPSSRRNVILALTVKGGSYVHYYSGITGKCLTGMVSSERGNNVMMKIEFDVLL
ncbi:hypothetical protein BUALT_Bualt07G0030500 [Buddleja alternifolia]|uniref:Uncharacterized protein n=1 Tax=Buddleja alternifolia TaxID=168488 RepID=A0AAV6X932_9LAMI|nr:hypothetical protein BUALT_Bualt07G0030500 [Buddleja alternifolia]